MRATTPMATTFPLRLDHEDLEPPKESVAAWGDRELSAVTLPTAMGPDLDNIDTILKKGSNQAYRSVFTTRVFAVPSEQTVPVRLRCPERPPSTSQRLSVRRLSKRACSAEASNGHARRPPVQSRPNTTGISTSRRCRLKEKFLRQASNRSGAEGWGRFDLHPHTHYVDQDAYDRQPAKQPRTIMNATRGLAIRRAVDACWTNSPSMPDSSPGATRFLQQWDRATRTQREELLRALADRLLSGGNREDTYLGSPLHVHFQRNVGSHLINRGEAGSQSTDVSLGPHNVGRSAPCRDRGPTACPSNISSHPEGRPIKMHDAEAVARNDGGVTGAAEILAHRRQAHTLPNQTAGIGNATAFLALLGPYAGLFAMRVASYLQTSHSCGHAIRFCLRATTLLAESGSATSNTSRGCTEDDGNARYTRGPGLLGDQLCTPGLISTALEIATAPAGRGSGHYMTTEREVYGAQRRRREVTKITVPPPSSKKTMEEEKVDEEEELENNRGEAFRLLLALIRAGGGRVKEYLACYDRKFSSGTAERGAESALAEGDAFGRLVMALCRPGTRVETRATGGRLLVELGRGELDRDTHHRPTGNERVWNTVLCLIGGLNSEDPAEGQVLGCSIALDLLGSPKPSSTRGGDRGTKDVPLGGPRSREQQTQQQQGLLHSGLTLLPSVLSLSLSGRRKVRKAAGELAVLLASDFSRPCCYLLVTCLVGLCGVISGVDRGAPVAWLRLKQQISPPTLGKTVPSRNDIPGHLSLADRSTIDESGVNCSSEDSGRRSDNHISRAGSFPRRGQTIPERQSEIGNTQEITTLTNSPFGENASGGHSAKTAKLRDESHRDGWPAPTASAREGIAVSIDEAIFAIELLQQICDARGAGDNEVVLSALAHALAPLAVLDLVVGPAALGADTFSTNVAPEDPKNAEKSFDANGRLVFVTQARTDAETSSAGFRGDASSGVGFNGPQDQDERDVLRAEENHPLRGEAPESNKFKENVLVDCSADGSRQRHHSVQEPPEALCRAVAEVLIAMYRRGRGVEVATGTGELGALEMIDGALDACPALYRSLYDGDSAAMATALYSGLRDSKGSEASDSSRVELATLRQNVYAMTARLGRVRPPPLPQPPAVDDGGTFGRRKGPCARQQTKGGDHERVDENVAERQAATFPKSHWNAIVTKKAFLDDVDRGSDNRGQDVRQEGSFPARKWVDPNDEGAEQRRREHSGRAWIDGTHTLGTRPRVAACVLQHERRQQWQRRPRPRAIAVTIAKAKQGETAAAASKAEEGPRVWGPEDWADSPTMAMLTEPVARQAKMPEREKEECHGPVWRSAFGGGRDPPVTSAGTIGTSVPKKTLSKSSRDSIGETRLEDTEASTPARSKPVQHNRGGGGGDGGGHGSRVGAAAAELLGDGGTHLCGSWPSASAIANTMMKRQACRQPRHVGSVAAERNCQRNNSDRARRTADNRSCLSRHPEKGKGAGKTKPQAPSVFLRRPARYRTDRSEAGAAPSPTAPSARPKPTTTRCRGSPRGGGEARTGGARAWEGVGVGDASPLISSLISLLQLSSAAIPPRRKHYPGITEDGTCGDCRDAGNPPRAHALSARNHDSPNQGERPWDRGGNERGRSDLLESMPAALQTTSIMAGAFKVAERCATTAVGCRKRATGDTEN